MKKKRKYYHATTSLFKKGDRLSATSSSAKGKNFKISCDFIYMTTSPYLHYTIAELISAGIVEKLFVYEVEPIDPKKVYHGNCWDEWVAREVEVIKKVGHATEIGKGLAKFVSGAKKDGTFLIDKSRKDQQKKITRLIFKNV